MATLFVDPGEFHTELVLEEAVAAPGGGARWQERAVVYGHIEPVTAFAAGTETATHRITLRHRDGLACGMRLTKGARKFAIISVHDPDESGRYLVCRTEERGE
jgi:SPP1 family predicted phage head-tail adaptor